MFTSSLHVTPPHPSSGRLAGSLHRGDGRTTWKGSLSASEPIVAMSFLRHGDQLYWAQSPKVTADDLPVDLLLAEGAYTDRSILYVTWSIGGGQTQIGLFEQAAVELPTSIEMDIVVGKLFHFADLNPSTSLFGLVLLRTQVKDKRNHRWALKAEYLEALPLSWRDIMVSGRTGTSPCDIANSA